MHHYEFPPTLVVATFYCKRYKKKQREEERNKQENKLNNNYGVKEK